MGQTLINGIFLPNEGERNCYTGLAGNWRAIDGYIGDYNVHVADAVIHVSQADRDKWDAVDDKADASALTAHTGDTTIHVTAEDKSKWNAVTTKADASALTAHTGDTTIHVTAADKQTWDTVTNKANDADVMHLSRNETAAGNKTFTDNINAKKIISNVSQLQINARSDADSVAVIAGASASDGGGVWVYGKNTSNKSMVTLQVYDANTSSYHAARLNMDGSLTPTVLNNGLGSKSFKWVGFNGINPGALSLPDLTAGVDISAYITNITGASNINKFTPTADGWISIGLSNADFIEIYIPASLMGATFTKSTMNSTSLAFMPVIANKEVKITLKGSSIGWAKFYPCQGNI